jgi:hypothetical protein
LPVTCTARTRWSAAAGFAPALYRAPYGHTGDTMLRVLGTEGYTSIGWDIDSTDWSDASVDAIVSSVLDQAHPGAIVLMHDGGLGGGNPERTTTLAALPRIIDGLAARAQTGDGSRADGRAATASQQRRQACSATAYRGRPATGRALRRSGTSGSSTPLRSARSPASA